MELVKAVIILYTAIHAVFCAPLKHAQFQADDDPQWIRTCNHHYQIQQFDDLTKHEKIVKLNNLKEQIDETLHSLKRFINKELDNWNLQTHEYEFLPIHNAEKTSTDLHKDLSVFIAAFQFLEKYQMEYIAQYSEALMSVMQKTKRLLCEVEKTYGLDWAANIVDKSYMNSVVYEYRLDLETANFLNVGFTEFYFRNYLNDVIKHLEKYTESL